MTERNGRLTATQTLDSHVEGEAWIYICGPPPVMHAFDKAFGDLGVPHNRIRCEQFDVR